ncbi:MAG: hypothetical protein LBL74_05795 [Bacteroidales bacterium]|nr:hypothetical protein [Bacteroidales bacterium]
MKKIILFVVVMAMTFGGFAQTMNVQSAFADFNAKRYSKAKQNIDAACKDDKTKTEAKTWFYSGLIYTKLLQLGISTDEKDIKMFKKQKIEEPIDTLAERAKEAFIKTIEIENAEGTKDWIKSAMSNLESAAIYFYNQCVTIFKIHEYQNAITTAEKVLNICKYSNTPTMKDLSLKAKYIIATSYLVLKDNDKANAMYRELVKDKTQATDVYINLYDANLAAKDTTKAINVLKAGVKNIPDTNDGNFQLQAKLAGVYLQTGNKEEGDKIVNSLKEKTNNNFEKLNILAAELSTTGGEAQAIEMFNQSLQIKPDQIGANFGIGLIHFNKAADYINLGNDAFEKGNNDLGAEYDTKAKEEFNAAIPNFKAVLKLEPKDFNSLKALRTIYSRLNMLDDYKEVDAVFQTLIKK